MSSKKIENGRWWNIGWKLVEGCTPCSPGCAQCWAMAMEKRFRRPQVGPSGCSPWDSPYMGVEIHPERLSIPMKRKNPAVYALWNDWAHEAVNNYFRIHMMDWIMCAPQHIYLLLTKRPQFALDFWTWLETKTTRDYRDELSTHVFFGLTICTQQEADEKIPVFLKMPGRKFLCFEPMLELVDLRPPHLPSGVTNPYWLLECFDGLILGAESLSSRPGREMKLEWAESIAEQCEAAGVPLFVKQLHIGGRLVKDMSQFPEKLRRRELPWL